MSEAPGAGTSVTASIRALAKSGKLSEAAALIASFLSAQTGVAIGNVRVNFDQYSLNSVNGFAADDAGRELFFKFHQEENEEDGVDEYYNAQVIKQAGYPVEEPLFSGTEPGNQFLVYERVHHPRLSDVCSEIEKGSSRYDPAAVIAAQEATDEKFAELAIRSLHLAEDEEPKRQAIFQLFYNRLKDAQSAENLGGRVARFYLGQHVDWPGLSAPFEDLWHLPWTINGLDYPVSLKEAFERALQKLSPECFFPGPAIAAHGDAHNANVWFRSRGDNADAGLVLFDPAFAGADIPALLAEVKATFHNIFAHPFWLYEPGLARERFQATARITDGRIVAETDYALSPLREAFLASKARHFWKPLIGELARRGWLAEDWQETVRLALFACPTLVMKLLPGEDSTHNPVSSLIGFCQAIRAVSPPADGASDMFVELFDGMT